MITRKMNERITFFNKVEKKNEDGEVVSGSPVESFSCWAEISKATVKEFKERTSAELMGNGLKKRKDSMIFIIRYQQQETIDSNMLIEFRGTMYEIINVETDYARKDFSLVSGVAVE
ncbi:phage head closure protein [Carnobacterium maltaromaticum]|uniref:phage head closure protein n=1 Tax=Carnobacterium maltaromaticum TaxID=2751 RepID=UPI0012F9FF44|nr:phage head closure protein [Carnobacterium maltaromaticum]